MNRAHALRNDVAPPERYPAMFATLFRLTMSERQGHSTRRQESSPPPPNYDSPDNDGGMLKTAVEDASEAVGGVIVLAAVAAYATTAEVSNTMLGALKSYNVL